MVAPHLPAEIWDKIVGYIPDANDSNVLSLPAHHVTTRTLRSLCLVCKATARDPASLLLYQHCLYIDYPWRLFALVRSYDISRSSLMPGFSRNFHKAKCVASSAL